MQFYVNGYKPGDPFVADPDPLIADRPAGLPTETDVLIVGAGPAGLVLAAQLAAFPEIRTVVIDRKDGPLEVGQADGVACRTVEMFEAFGLADRLINEGYHVNEVAFWRPAAQDRGKIARTGIIDDVEEGISEMPHVIVNQARMLAYLLDHMERSPSRLRPHYGLHAGSIQIDETGASEYPVTVELAHLTGLAETGETSTLKARYVIGCDGSRSGTRQAIGRELKGDPMNQSWGVLDALVTTDFPDIRRKCAIHSANDGNMLIIPREGGYLVRFYIELDNMRDAEILRNRSATPEKLVEVANRILDPYSIDVKSVGWWAVYEIGQRVTDKFDDVPADQVDTRLPHVFIAGDACHTHSAKAGQGMNVSMNDTWNLGWKLASVLLGRAKPELLHTYSAERQQIAQQLIDFDREFAAMFSAHPTSNHADAAAADTDVAAVEKTVDPAVFQQYFQQQGRFTAGVATTYEPSMITGRTDFQELAAGFTVGMRFHSAPVTRVADARSVHLGHVARADAAWRLYVFADEAGLAGTRVSDLCAYLDSPTSPITRFTPKGADPDAVLDVRAIFQQGHRELEITDLPAVLTPAKGEHGLVDHEKAFTADPRAGDIFDLRGINRQSGAMVLVRPDQYVAAVLPLHAHEALTDFLAGILVEAV
jgi:phenol 2-monooxygenase